MLLLEPFYLRANIADSFKHSLSVLAKDVPPIITDCLTAVKQTSARCSTRLSASFADTVKPKLTGGMARLVNSCSQVSGTGKEWFSSIIEKTGPRYQQLHLLVKKDIDIDFAFSQINKSLEKNFASQVVYDEMRSKKPPFAGHNGLEDKMQPHTNMKSMRDEKTFQANMTLYWENWKKEELVTIVMSTVNQQIDAYCQAISMEKKATVDKRALTNHIIARLRDPVTLQRLCDLRNISWLEKYIELQKKITVLTQLQPILPKELTAQKLTCLAQSTIVKMTNEHLQIFINNKNRTEQEQKFNKTCSDKIYQKFYANGPKLHDLRNLIDGYLAEADIKTDYDSPNEYMTMPTVAFSHPGKTQNGATQTGPTDTRFTSRSQGR